MVGKARSSNFTVSEKLDLLKLVKPYVNVLEQHTNKHSVIVEKNKCWDIIADKYNAIGADRPPRTAQGLRTLYKRLKEYAKQEFLQFKNTQLDYQSTVSEPTKKVLEMIPQITTMCFLRDGSSLPSAEKDTELNAGTSSQQADVDHQPAAVTVELEQDEDVKPILPLTVAEHPTEVLEDREDQESIHTLQRSPSPSLSSLDMRMTLSPSPVPRRDGFCIHQTGEHLRQICGCVPQTLQMLKEEHQMMIKNQRKIGLYIQEKRDGLKRRQQLEEELLKAKIKVERLKAMKLRRDLPGYNSL
ncbi:fibrinogen silencer-binding protein [Microcaecilia unicolor]|uniref:Fibrinogen silencer-binding protein n=1 Tax=Microcaecilia unicolor TaxID=1415580 RepID=A0A6P7Z7G4_9AMPH|nr:fibrinogen silencer-binding protein [Microcaecilia unicolor]